MDPVQTRSDWFSIGMFLQIQLDIFECISKLLFAKWEIAYFHDNKY